MVYINKSIALPNRKMGKRGMIEPVSLILFLTVIASVGGATYFLITGDNHIVSESTLYVGDLKAQRVYNSNCAKYISEDSRVYFPNIEVALKSNFTYSECE